jgi:nitrogen fixation protein NifZ
MDEISLPKFQWGQPVLTIVDLVNDGSYPDCAVDELLASQGTTGEVVQVGSHVDTQTPIYLVEFPNGRVVGCLEEEIIAAA